MERSAGAATRMASMASRQLPANAICSALVTLELFVVLHGVSLCTTLVRVPLSILP